MSEREDHILEAGLAEIVGGVTPPDLTARILQAAAQRQASPQQPAPAAPNRLLPPVVEPVAPVGSSNGNGANGSHVYNGNGRAIHLDSRRPRRMQWLPIAVAASLLVALLGYSIFHNPQQTAQQPKHRTKITKDATVPSDPEPVRSPPRPEVPKVAVPEVVAPEVPPAPEPAVAQQPGPTDTVPVDTVPVIPQPQPETFANPTRPTVPQISDVQVVARINEQIAAGWEVAGVSPSPPASDAEWCRRVYLDVIGRIPTADEVHQFVENRSPEKRLQLVDRLLHDEYYDVEYARHWTTVWTNLLIGRSRGMDPEGVVNREGLQQWLRRAFLKNKPYDRFVSELIAADGTNTPGDDDFNGAVNFMLDNLASGQVPATNRVSELFLGRTISCAQCHNHPFNNWTQENFWEFNAFFKQAHARKTLNREKNGRTLVVTRLVDEDFAGEEQPFNPNEAAIFFERRNGFMVVAYPRFEKQKIGRSGFVDVVNRRDELAQLVVASPSLGQAIVNRMWAQFFGFGFANPVDDMGPHNPPSHPELLSRLAEQFVAHDYDLKRLIRWIVLSEPYSLSSRFNKANERDDPQRIDLSRGERLAFSRFYPRQMEAEQLYESLVGHDQHKSAVDRERHKTRWVQQFVYSYQTDDNNEAMTFDGSIPQALTLFNGDLVQQSLSIKPGSFLADLAAARKYKNQVLDHNYKVERLYWTALNRKPTPEEYDAAGRLFALRPNDTVGVLQDIWWALLNSNEFILNH